MRKILGVLILLSVFAIPSIASADGCFLCEGGGYVKYKGDDTFPKRKEAKEKFGCNVSGTTSSCSHEEGTVGFLEILRQERHAKK